VQICRLFFTAF